MRRCISGVSTSLAALAAHRDYRVIPHIEWEVEELAETQKAGRWQVHNKYTMSQPETKGEAMCHKLNFREARRRGVLPEKSIIRRVADTYGVDGKKYENDPAYQMKYINITVVGFDGHPFHFRVPPMPDVTLNALIDGSGMNMGATNYFNKCNNKDCTDAMHGEGCLINVDLETLDRLLPPGRFEYNTLNNARIGGARPDISYTSRFSCQLRITPELDGGLFAMKQINGAKLIESVQDWGHYDDLATLGYARCRQVEPFAPYMEEPLETDFPITLDMLWEDDWEEIMKHKYPKWARKDGFHTKPTAVGWYV